MTLVLDLDLDVLKVCLCNRNKVCRSRHWRVRVWTGLTGVQGQTSPNTLPCHIHGW